MSEYHDKLGLPKVMNRQELLITSEAVSRISETMHNFYYESDDDTDHEAWLLSRVRMISRYHCELLAELEDRKANGSDVICTHDTLEANP